MKRVTLAISILFFLLGPVGRAEAEDTPTPPASLRALPDELDLGRHAIGTALRHSVWLLNTGDEPVRLLRSKGSCSCTTVRFNPTTLPPQAALEVPLRVVAPVSPGISKSVSVTFFAEDHPPIRLPVRVASEGEPLGAERAVVAEPDQVDLGPVVAGELISASARLINTGHAPRRVTAARTSCSCVKVIGFAPFTLGPGEAADIHLEVDAPAAVGRSVTKDLTVAVEGQAVVKIPVRLETGHPLVDDVERYLDVTLAPKFAYGNFRLEDNAITAVAWTADRSTPKGRVTCRLTAEGRVESVLLEAIETIAPDTQSGRALARDRR